MRYVCLIYDDEKAREKMPKADADAMMGEYVAFTEDISQKGHYLTGEALQPTALFAETMEQLGGFYPISARDLNEAIQIAARIPSARFGSIEVRPVVEFDR